MLKIYATAAAMVVAGSLGFSSASAATYFGQDVSGVSPDNSATWTNSNNARNDFIGQLDTYGEQDFEGFANGTVPPIALDFPPGSPVTATLSNNGIVNNFRDRGRFNTTAGGSNYYQVVTGNDFQIEFSTDVAAFGFYGTDIGDFQGQLVIEFYDENDNLLFSEDVGASGAPNENILFYGIVADSAFRSVRFSAIGGNDGFGFDDMIVGTASPGTNPVPLPAAGWLLLSGVVGIAGLRRFGRKA
jgi:hypothetical protein